MTCAFCDDGAIKNRVILENDLAFAFPTESPITPGHTLICPKRHVAISDVLTKDEIIALFALKSTIAKALHKALGAEGFNYAWNEAEIAGQSVPHVHLHVVPRTKGDTGIYEYEPRQFLYRPGTRKISKQEELEEVAATIRHYAV